MSPTNGGRIGKVSQIFLGVLVISVLVSAGTAFFVASQRTQSSPASESIYEKVVERQTLRCGYIIYPPDSFKDVSSGRIYGIFPDVLAEAASRLGYKLEWIEEVSWGTMIEGLRTGRYDMMGTGVLRTASRAKAAHFTIPLFYEATGAFVRQDDNRFDGKINLINSQDVRIAVIDGEISDIVARSDFPKANRVSLPQLGDPSQLLLDVSSNKADVTFLATRLAARYLAANPGTIRNIALEHPVRISPVCYMIPIGDPQLESMINAALLEIHSSGLVRSIVQKYEEFPGSYYFNAPPFTPPSNPVP